MDAGQDHGLARARILRQIDTSLARLGVERIALYMTHAFDPEVPQEETLRAFDSLVRAGKVGAVGASNFNAAQLAEALEISQLEGLARYEWVQNSYSLLDLDDREAVFPFLRDRGLGYVPFSPLAGGWLTGKYRRGAPFPTGSRMTQRPESYVGYITDRVFDALDALAAEAADRGVSMAGLALAWLLGQPEVTGIVVGPGRAEHLVPASEAIGLQLHTADVSRLTEVFS